jgi:hypothetical protein
LRLPIANLILSLRWLQDAIEREVLSGRGSPHYSARFISGIEYARSILELDVDRTALGGFQMKLSLPRHVGLLQVYSAEPE